jgi:hypothetical protein
LAALASEIDPVTARIVARNFYLTVSTPDSEAIRKDASTVIEFELAHQGFADPDPYHQDSRKSVPYPLYYVFNVLGDKGFVMVSGNELVKPILGYALTGAFRESQQSPEFQAWMKSYKKQILFTIENDPGADSGVREEWNELKEGSSGGEGGSEGLRSCCMVLPLVTTKWNQGCLYNEFCPADAKGPCERAYAGCMAVAMAQLLNYWKHPAICNWLEGYHDQENRDINLKVIPDSEYGWIGVDTLSAYDWSMMPDELNDESAQLEIDEVSRLVFHCGVSVKMNYGPFGSAADGADITSALSDCFNYSHSIQYIRRQNYTPAAWKNLLKVELDMGRPVIYMGEGNKGGHGFICDGYGYDGYFHFNWGWGGANDAYYVLDALAPGSISLVDAQRAIIGISPDYRATDPCENIILLNGEGVLNSGSFRGGDEGSWDNYVCGWSTPGREQIFGFVAPSTGLYSMVVTVLDSYVDCAWKDKECRKGGWNCIGDICSAGIYGPMSWEEGETYYILVDDEDTVEGNFEFYLEPQVSTCVNQTSLDHQLNVSIHPVSQVITIESNQSHMYAVDIVSVNGCVLYTERNIETPWKFNVSFLPKGFYFLTLRANDFLTTRRIVKL